MQNSYLKLIFIILIIVLGVSALYINLFWGNKKDNSSLFQTNFSKEKETLISNNIRIGIIEFDNINPILSNNKNVQDISRLIFEPLFMLTEDYKLTDALAKECSKLDNKTYIIKLKENITWQDGNKFDSSDVFFTIDILKDLENASVYYYNVKDIEEVEKIDEYTIKIKLNKEIPYFEYNLIFPIVSSKYFDKDNFKLENKNIKPVGTGMFYISETENNSILLKKSIRENVTEDLKLDTITLKLYDSLTGAINAFKTGEIDIFTTSNREIEDYLKNVNYNKIEYINRNYSYISLNCSNNILSNKEVRQAINSAIDKNEIIRDVYNEKNRISNFPLDFGSYVYDKNNSVMTYDANTAKNLLLDNGWKYTSKKWRKTVKNKYLKIELNLIVNKEDSYMVKVSKKIKEQLESIGMIITIKDVDNKQYNTYLKNKNYDMILLNSSYSYSPSLDKYFGNSNIANYQNEEITDLLDEVKNSTDENEIKQKYSRIVEIYNDEVPYISLFFNQNTMIYSTNLKGNISPNSYNLFYKIENWYREYKKE